MGYNELFDGFKLIIKEGRAVSEDEELIKVNMNETENLIWSNNMWLKKENSTNDSDYILEIGIYTNSIEGVDTLAKLPIYLNEKELLKKQKELLKFYGFDVSFEEKDRLIPMNEKCRIINEDYLYSDYSGFINKYNIKGWESDRPLPRYYKNIEFTLIGKAKHIVRAITIYVIEVEGDIWLINEKGCEIINDK